MSTGKHLALATLVGAFAIGVAQAQTPPSPDNTAPDAASSPHQRDATGQSSTESSTSTSPDPSAASTPHQREATSGDSKMGKMKMAADSSGADPATFVKKAAQGGMTEVELGKIAQSKTQDPAVRKFADDMVKDHGKANNELASLAKGKGLTVPAALDAEHKAIVQKLNSKSGADFDAAYSKQMVMDHDKTIALFQGATKSSDADLAAFAKKTLPTLEEHKQMADSLPASSRSAEAGSTSRH
jgi:putative membrane protein